MHYYYYYYYYYIVGKSAEATSADEADSVTATRLINVGVSWSRIHYITADGRLCSHGAEQLSQSQHFLQVIQSLLLSY